MKKTEIEKLTLEDLASLAADRNVAVPEGLSERTALLLDICEQRERPRSRLLPAAGIAAAVAVLLAAGFLLKPSRPKDTFEDPVLAYAAVEAALQRMTHEMTIGARMVSQAQETMEKPGITLERIANR